MYVTLLLFEISILKGPDHLLIELSELEKHSGIGMLQVWPPTTISASLVNEHIEAPQVPWEHFWHISPQKPNLV